MDSREGGSVRVLVVDDDPLVAAFLSELIPLWGTRYRVDVASSGEAAVEAVHQFPPDVVLLDVVMPGIGGIEALRRIHRSHPDLPVIVMTGLGADLLSAAEESGAYACIGKPLNENYLRSLIEMSQRRAGRDPAVAAAPARPDER